MNNTCVCVLTGSCRCYKLINNVSSTILCKIKFGITTSSFNEFRTFLYNRNYFLYDTRSLIIVSLLSCYGMSFTDIVTTNFNANITNRWNKLIENDCYWLKKYYDKLNDLNEYFTMYNNSIIVHNKILNYNPVNIIYDSCKSLLHEHIYIKLGCCSTINNKFVKSVIFELLAKLLVKCPLCKEHMLESEHLIHRGDLYCSNCFFVDIDVKSSKYFAIKHYDDFIKNNYKVIQTRYVCYVKYNKDNTLNFVLLDCKHNIILYESPSFCKYTINDLTNKTKQVFDKFIKL